MGAGSNLTTRAIAPGDHAWVAELLTRHFGDAVIESRDVAFDTRSLPGLIALDGTGAPDDCARTRAGALVHTPLQAHAACEIIALAAATPGQRVGSTLLAAFLDAARRARCTRVFLTTSNDNIPALRFYQRRGARIVAVHPDAITRARMRRPTIPLRGHDDILIADELELEFAIAPP